jgi:hypothetical protein
MHPILFVLCAQVAGAQPEQEALREGFKAFKAGDYAGARVFFEQVAAANPANNVAQNQLRVIAQKEARTAALTTALSRIILDKVQLHDASAREAFDYLVQKVKAAAGGAINLNIVWMVPADHPSRITLSLEAIPAREALVYAAQAGGLEVLFDEYAVKVSPPAPAEGG